jgi:hypothetical protein
MIRIVTAAVLCAGAIPIFTLTAAPAAAEPDCRPLVVGVGGNGQHYADERGARTIVGDILAHEGAQDQRTVNVDYSSSVWPTGPYFKDYSVADGRAETDRVIAEYRAECPDGEVTVVGHSLGAEVVGPQDADNKVVLGDPRKQGGVYDNLPTGIMPGLSNPGVRDEEAEGVVSVCREFDAICDTAAPWEDPAKFAQSWAGYAMGWHGYSPEEVDQYQDAPPGEYMIEAPAPIPWLPESTPTGIPDLPEFSLPPVELPVPLPSTEDVTPILSVGQPYVPTPIEAYVPEYVEAVLPPEVLDFVPPPLPEIHIPGVF